ncbi:hypothetical protein G6F63_012790 [Rhizopus arrhizus]|nr:hypothetical protein G6F63_012790 [Rhizopus arrhizus]
MSESSSSSDLHLFSLPLVHKPGTDLMSKWILSESQVTNIIVTSIIGNHAQGKYVSRPTEWPNFMKSDVLYCPIKTVKANKLPPLLVEVQYTANMAFFRRLMEYSLSINKHYHALPVVLAICVHNTTPDLMELSTPSSTLPFLVELPCVGWAKSCYLMNAGSIAKHLQEIPLNPFVAVGHFLIEQKPSLADMIHRDDKTIIMLYELAKKVFGDQHCQFELEHGSG